MLRAENPVRVAGSLLARQVGRIRQNKATPCCLIIALLIALFSALFSNRHFQGPFGAAPSPNEPRETELPELHQIVADRRSSGFPGPTPRPDLAGQFLRQCGKNLFSIFGSLPSAARPSLAHSSLFTSLFQLIRQLIPAHSESSGARNQTALRPRPVKVSNLRRFKW